MELRNYQSKALGEIKARFSHNERDVVLAAAPNSGKTLIALVYIKEYLQADKSRKAHILTHGTIVLRNQWSMAIESAELSNEVRLTYGLPHSKKERADIGEVSLLVIDEAHEFTHAAMVQDAIEELKPKQILYLTGTPSKFIAKGGYALVQVSGFELLHGNYMADLYVGLVQSTYDPTEDAYNEQNDLKDTHTQGLEDNVTSDLDALLGSMVQRLAESEGLKRSPQARRLVSWAPTLGKLHKTMIACRSILQSERVVDYFESKGISVIGSNSLSDPDTLNIQKFIDDESIRVLVVVDRGILGFNLPHLVNVVDLTMSHNPDRIYQLLSRATRLHEKYTKKYFFKITSEPKMPLTKLYMTAALCLMDPEFVANYNGKNLDGMRIPVIRTAAKKAKGKTASRQPGKVSNNHNIDALFHATLSTYKVLYDVYNKIGVANEYAYVTFGRLREDLGQIVRDPERRKEEILEESRRLGRRLLPSHKFYYSLQSYVSSSNNCFDPKFKEEYNKEFPSESNPERRKEEILEESRRLGRRLPKSHKFSGSLRDYVSPSGGCFDPKFREEYNKEFPPLRKRA